MGVTRKGWRYLAHLFQPFPVALCTILKLHYRPIDGCDTERLAKFDTSLPAFPYMHHSEATYYRSIDGCDTESLVKFRKTLPPFPYNYVPSYHVEAFLWVQPGIVSEI